LPAAFPTAPCSTWTASRSAVNAALTEEAGAALQYGATEGYNPLREQLAAFMASKGCTAVAPENLIVTTGSQQALDLLGKTMISPGDKVIVEGPTFLATIQCFRLYGAELISAPIDGNGVQTDELEEADRRAQAQVRLPDPHLWQPQRRHAEPGAPQGRAGAGREVPDPDRRRRPLRRPVFSTATTAHRPACWPEPAVPGSRELLAHCGSLSKVLSPGLRVGWMIAPAELLAKATMCKQFSDAHTSTFAQATAAQYLKAGRMPATLAHVRKVYAERAQAMGDACAANWATPSSSCSPRAACLCGRA
jgi:2-aminoadipate transaminase